MELKTKIFLGIAWISLMQAVEIPDDLQKCHYGDEPCIVKSANQFIRLYSKGISEIGFGRLDSIHVDDIVVFGQPDISFFYNLTKQVLRGFENATITKISGFDREPDKHKIEIELTIPRLLMESTFNFLVTLLTVPLGSTGPVKSDLQNVRIRFSARVFFRKSNYKRYMNIYDIEPTIEIDRLIASFDNLYTENTDLGFALNQVINENWIEFWDNIRPSIVPVYCESIRQHVQKMLQIVAYDDWFLQD